MLTLLSQQNYSKKAIDLFAQLLASNTKRQ